MLSWKVNPLSNGPSICCRCLGAALSTWRKLTWPFFSFSSASWSHALESTLGWFPLFSVTDYLLLRSLPSGTLFGLPCDPLCAGAWSIFRALKKVSTSRKAEWRSDLCHCGHSPVQSLTSIQRHFNSVAPHKRGHYRVIFKTIFLKWKILIALLYNYIPEYLYHPYLSCFWLYLMWKMKLLNWNPNYWARWGRKTHSSLWTCGKLIFVQRVVNVGVT